MSDYGEVSSRSHDLHVTINIVIAVNGIITSSRVEEAMKMTDRKHYCPHNFYQDTPQSIGQIL